jgi:hypothetical protein
VSSRISEAAPCPLFATLVRLAPESKCLARNNKSQDADKATKNRARPLAPLGCRGAFERLHPNTRPPQRAFSNDRVNDEDQKALSWADIWRAQAVNGNPLLGASGFGDGKDSRNRMGFVQQPATRIASSRLPHRQVFAFVVSDEAPPGGVIVFERALKGWIATACTHFLPSMK